MRLVIMGHHYAKPHAFQSSKSLKKKVCATFDAIDASLNVANLLSNWILITANLGYLNLMNSTHLYDYYFQFEIWDLRKKLPEFYANILAVVILMSHYYYLFIFVDILFNLYTL